MLDRGLDHAKLKVFSIGKSGDAQRAIDLYFRKQYQQNHSKADAFFCEQLDTLVNSENGLVGQHSGWARGGLLHSSGYPSRHKVAGVQDDGSELDESQGGEDRDEGEDEDEEQSPRPPAIDGSSKALKKPNKQVADPKGKGRATPRAQGDPSRSQGGDHAERSPPHSARASRLTSTVLQKAKEQFAVPKGKSTPRRDSRAGTPIRTSVVSPGDSSNVQSPSSPSGKMKEEKPSGMDERDAEGKGEEDDGDTLSDQSSGYTEGLVEEEHTDNSVNEEHTNEGTAANVPLTSKYWKGFLKVLDGIEEKDYASVDDWYQDAREILERHRQQLDSMSKN
jgi:hypothetical protein